MSTLSFKAENLTSEQWPPDSLEDSSCPKNHPKSIPYSSSKFPDVTDFWIKNSRIQMTPEIKSKKCNSTTEAGPTVGQHRFIHCSGNTMFENSQNERIKCGRATSWTIGEPLSADPNISAAVEGRFLINRG